MDFNNFSITEFEKVRFRLTRDITLNDKTFSAGETIAFFDTIQIFGLDQKQSIKRAKGGARNMPFVFWEDNQELNLTFSNGVFSKERLALGLKTKLINQSENALKIWYSQESESDEDGNVLLDKVKNGNLFVYDINSGDKYEYEYSSTTNKINISEPYKDVHIDYEFLYDGQSSKFVFGEEEWLGFLEMEGITKIKDSQTGKVVTGLVKVPKLRLSSNISLRLGKNAKAPVSEIFNGIGVPVGNGRNAHSWELYILEEDIYNES